MCLNIAQIIEEYHMAWKNRYFEVQRRSMLGLESLQPKKHNTFMNWFTFFYLSLKSQLRATEYENSSPNNFTLIDEQNLGKNILCWARQNFRFVHRTWDCCGRIEIIIKVLLFYPLSNIIVPRSEHQFLSLFSVSNSHFIHKIKTQKGVLYFYFILRRVRNISIKY